MKVILVTLMLLFGVAFGQTKLAQGVVAATDQYGQPVECSQHETSGVLLKSYDQQIGSSNPKMICYAVNLPLPQYQSLVNSVLMGGMVIDNLTQEVVWARGVEKELYAITLENNVVSNSFHFYNLKDNQSYVVMYSWNKP